MNSAAIVTGASQGIGRSTSIRLARDFSTIRQIPIEGEPADVAEIAAAYAEWLATSNVPKLFVKAEPGLLIAGGANLDFARGLPAQTEVTVAGVHYLQEDSPDEIGQAIADWMGTLG